MIYIIAEVGGNHEGDIDKAKSLIEDAADAGCNAVKFQTYQADKLVHPSAKALPQAIGYKKQRDRFKDLEFTAEQWQEIINTCHINRIDFLTTCFDIENLERYAKYQRFIKVSSGDLTYTKLLRACAMLDKPVLLSTGMANFEEIKRSASLFSPSKLTIMHCVSAYPCPPESANLGVIKNLLANYSNVGYSDHTVGITACIAAAAMGCTVIEKHFTYDMTLEHGDHCLSLDKYMMAAMVRHIREVEKMLGTNKPDPIEMDNRKVMRRGCYAGRDIRKNEILNDDDVLFLRPATRQYPKKAPRDFKKLERLDG